MIHNFIVCLNAVIPLVLYLVVGMLVRKYSVQIGRASCRERV